MSTRYKGSVLSATAATNSQSAAVGIWRPNEVLQAVNASLWPLGITYDPYFEYVTLLLHGDGTNGAQNNTFLDSSTNNFTITRNGNTTQGTFTPYGPNWSNYFNGSSQYLSLTDSTNGMDLGGATASFEAWIYPTAATCVIATKYGGVANYNTTNGIEYTIALVSQQFLMYYNVAGTFGTLSDPTTGRALNQWYHIVVASNATTLSLYVNGTRAVTATAGITKPTTRTTVRLGLDSASTYLTGYLSNVRFIQGTGAYDASQTTITVPTSALTAVTNTKLLTCQSNRFIDNSTNAYAITATGSPTIQRFSPFSPPTEYSTSVIGGSGYFDGTGDYLTLTDLSNVLDIGGAIASLEMWVYSSNVTSAACAFVKGGGANSYSTSNGIEYVLLITGGTALFAYNTGGSSANITGTVIANAWNHIAIATNASNTISLFVNGTRAATATNAITKPTTRTSIRIAESFAGGEEIIGYISGLRMINGSGAYDASQTTITVPTTPPTAVTNTQLLTNFTNAGIYDNAMMNDLETVGNTQVSTSVKKFGTGSMAFDGTGDWLLAPSSVNFNLSSGNWTIESWYYPTTYSASNNVIVYLGASSVDKIVIATIAATGYLYYLLNGTAVISTTSAATLNAWSHYALVKNGATTTLYLNGTSIGTTTSVPTSSGKSLSLGADSGGAAYIGYMDDFRITNGYARYTSTFTPPTAAFPNQ